MLQAQCSSKNIILDFKLTANGEPTYTVNYKNKAVVLESAMGIKLKKTLDALDFNERN
jgi:hypothetical protein